MVVHPHGAELEGLRQAHGPADVTGPDAGGEAVVDAVGPGDGLVLVGEALHADDGAEQLLLDDLGVLGGAGHHGGLEEEAVAADLGPAGDHLGALLAGALDDARHALALGAGHHRPEVDALVGGIAHGQAGHRFGEAGHQVVVDAGPRHHPAGGGAVLAGVVVAADLHGFDHGLEVGVVEHQHRGLAAELEVDARQAVGGGLGDGLARADASRQRDQADQRVGDERSAGGLALAGDHVEHARRQDLVLGDELGHAQRGEGGELGGLEHHGVAGGEGRTDLPDGHHQRVVPRGDGPHHAERVAAQERRVAGHVLAGGAALEGAGGAGEEAQVVDHLAHLVGHGVDGLAHVLALELAELVAVLVEHLGQLPEGVGPVARRGRSPLAGEGCGGGRHRGVDVVLVARGDLREGEAGGRIEDGVFGAAPCRYPLAADEVLVGHVPSGWSFRPLRRIPSYFAPQTTESLVRC